MKISEAIWRGANKCLWNGRDWNENNHPNGETYSCCAVIVAEKGPNWMDVGDSRAVRFLKELGWSIHSQIAFAEFAEGEERQGARYLSLMFAYQIAKDEGL